MFRVESGRTPTDGRPAGDVNANGRCHRAEGKENLEGGTTPAHGWYRESGRGTRDGL